MLGRAFLAMMLAIAPAAAADLTARSKVGDYSSRPPYGDNPPGARILNQGCCSWHEGVRLCERETGRVICKDGWSQSSCAC